MTAPDSAPRRSLIGRVFFGWLTLLRHMAPPTLFFFFGFNLILWTTRLALAEHGIDVKGFATATVAALLVGKAVPVTDSLRFMARFDGAPLIQPILFKSAIYWLCVFLVRLVEALVPKSVAQQHVHPRARRQSAVQIEHLEVAAVSHALRPRQVARPGDRHR